MIQVKGFKQLQRKLKELPKAAQKRVARKAVRAGATIVARAYKSEVPVDQGLLKKAQTSQVTSRRSGAAGIIGADQGKLDADASGGKRPSNIDWLVENGHVAPDGTVIPPSGYKRRAEAKSLPAAGRAIADKMAIEIEREAMK